MLSAGEIGLVQGAMNALNMRPDLVERVMKLLTTNSEQLTQGRQQVTPVGEDWFGRASTAHRISTNTLMAHQAVEEEFAKLAQSLIQYSNAIKKWSTEVDGIDADTNAEMTMRAAALAEVQATLDDARQRATDDDMGDGTYTEPPVSPAPAPATTSEETS